MLLRLCCVLRVNGPIFPDHPSSGDAPDSEFFRLAPSQFSNGCFIARLSRQVRAELVKDADSDWPNARKKKELMADGGGASRGL